MTGRRSNSSDQNRNRGKSKGRAKAMSKSKSSQQIDDEDDLEQQVLGDLKRSVVQFTKFSFNKGDLAKLLKLQRQEDTNENAEARSMRSHEEFVERKVTNSHVNTVTIGSTDDYFLESDSEAESDADPLDFFAELDETVHQSSSTDMNIDNNDPQTRYIEIDELVVNPTNTSNSRISETDSSFGFNVLSLETLKNITNPQWKSLGFEEESPRIITNNNQQSKKFNITNFIKELSSCLKDFKNGEEDFHKEKEILSQEEGIYLEKYKCVSAKEEENVSEVYDPLTKDEWDRGIVQTIFKIDYDRFLHEACRGIAPDGSCGKNCLCNNLASVRKNQTPLHLMAALSPPEVINWIISPNKLNERSHVLREILKEKFNNHDSERVLKHYEKVVTNWIHTYNRYRMTPADIAATRDSKEVIRVFMNHSATFSAAVSSAQRRECEPSLLSHLAYHSNWKAIDREDLIALVHSSTREKLEYVGSVAAQNGDTEFIEQLEYIRSNPSLFESLKKCRVVERLSRLRAEKEHEAVTMLEQRLYTCSLFDPSKDERHADVNITKIVPGQILANGRKLDYHGEKFTIAQELAEHGHYEAFNGLRDHQKRVTDCYGFTPLISLLQFKDEEVRTQLPLFRSVKREDLFLFISQVIVKERRGLLKDALDMTLSNPDNFSVIPRLSCLYKEYGLPDYVDLPMETALSRTGDMSIIETICDSYKKSDNFTRKMKEEDALRCIKSIQDRASRCTEQVRLAVILLMLQFVDVYSSRFRGIMRMYLNQGMEDNVSRYVLRTYSKPNLTNKLFPKDWVNALEDASTAVNEWNGSVEKEYITNINKTVHNRILETGTTEKSVPIIGTKEKLTEMRREEQQLNLKPRKKFHIIKELANAIELLDKLQM